MATMPVRSLLAVSLALAGCLPRASAPSDVRVVNGSPAAAGAVPAVVQVAIDSVVRSELCTGTFVTPRQLLLAAHCVTDNSHRRVVSLTRTGTEATVVLDGPHHAQVGGAFVLNNVYGGAPKTTAYRDVYEVAGTPDERTLTFAVAESEPATGQRIPGSPLAMLYYQLDVVPVSAVTVGGVAAARVDVEPSYLRKPWHHVATDDLAVVTFSSDVAPATLPLATRPLEDGDTVSILGFGATSALDPAPPVDGFILRRGTSVFRAADQADVAGTPGMIVAFGPPVSRPDDPRAGASAGDSGGPLLTADGLAILGVTSGGGLERGTRKPCKATTVDCSSLWVDVQSPTARGFLAAVLDASNRP